MDYAAIHEFGGTIRAKQKSYLTFQIGGSWKRVSKVIIPARPYLGPGVLDNLDKVANIIKEAVAKEVE